MRYLLTLLLFSLSLAFPKNAVEVKVNQPGKLIIEVVLDSAWIAEDGFVHTQPALNPYLNPGSPILPYWQEVFIGLPADADVQIYKNESSKIGKYAPIVSKAEYSKDMDFELPIAQEYDGTFIKNYVNLKSLYHINNLPVSKLELFPFQIENGKLFMTMNITVDISWNSNEQTSIVKLLSKISSPQYFKEKTIRKTVSNKIPEYQFYPNIAKITVDTTAWYSISNNELLAQGIELSEVNNSSIRLWSRGNEIPLYIEIGTDNVFNDEDILIFYGEKNPPPEWVDYHNNFYTNDNVYWLTWGTGIGLRYNSLDVSPDLSEENAWQPHNFISTVTIERDDEYHRINKNNQYLLQTWDVIDHFFMTPELIVSGPFDFEFELDSPDLSSDDGFTLEVRVRGMTTLEHELDIHINDNFVGNAKWSARNSYHIEITDIDCSYLNDGVNTLSLNLSPNDSDVHDLVYLNWYNLAFPRLFQTDSDYIKFSSDKNNQKTTEFEIAGLSNDDIYLFKNNEEFLTNFQIDINDNIKFQDSDTTAAIYEVFTINTLLSVKDISLESSITSILQNTDNEYVIIAPDSFFTILEPLAHYHDAAIVEIEDIYRQYSHGVLSPYGIKSFLEDIYYYNNESLKYVLFTMSPNEIDWWTGNFNNITSIPAMFNYTYNMGVVVCDYWYGTFNEEYWNPDISIGRFPVNTKEELQVVVVKTMYHHTRNTIDWDNNILLIGGSDIGFRYQNEALVDNIKESGNFIKRLYVAQIDSDSSFYGTSDTLAMHFSNGLSYINFFGHGGGRVWEDNGLLTYSNISNLTNPSRLPFISSMSCFTGDFSYNRALSRQMVEYENGGALAWYSASGLGWNYNDYYMDIPLQELLFSEDELTIGEIINLSKTKYYLAYSDQYPEIAPSQIYQYNLIGDPGIKLKNPTYDTVYVDTLDTDANDTIVITPEVSNCNSLNYQIFLPDNYSLNYATFQDGNSPFELVIPDTFQKGIYDVNLAFISDNQWYNSSQMITVSESYIDIVGTIPEVPTVCDSFDIMVEAIDKNGISSVQLFVDDEYYSDMHLSDSSDIYILENLVPPQPSGTVIDLSCMVIDVNNDTTYSRKESIAISEIPDISPISGGFLIEDSINVNVEIQSATSTAVEVFAELFINSDNNWNSVGQDTVNISDKEIQIAVFPGYFPNGINEYMVITEANMSCQSEDITSEDTLYFELETYAFWVTPELGTTDDGITHSVIGIEDIEIDIAAGTLNERNILEVSKIREITFATQPDFESHQVRNDYDGIQIKFTDDIQYFIEWELNSNLLQEEIELYQYFNDYLVWLPIDCLMHDDSIAVFQSSGTAKFAFLNANDSEKPTLTATINNQTYLENIYLNDNPNIQVAIYDNNGIDFRSSELEYRLNDELIEDFEYEVSGSANNLNLNFSPSLTALDSNISILSKDAAGNQSDTFNISFIISEKMDIFDYGNFPNPFSDKTIFAYELTEAVDRFSLTIYSVEGRKIRELKDEDVVTGISLQSPGYHEVEWNGKNRDGFLVNNGNYFYQMKAKKNKKTVKKNGKIVKVK